MNSSEHTDSLMTEFFLATELMFTVSISITNAQFYIMYSTINLIPYGLTQLPSLGSLRQCS